MAQTGRWPWPVMGRAGGVAAFGGGVVLVAAPVLWAIDPFGVLGRRFIVEQFLIVALIAAFVVTFCGAGSRPVLRWTLGLACLALSVPLLAHFGSDAALFVGATPLLVAVSAGLVTLCLLAVLRTSGRGLAGFLLAALVLGYLVQFAGAPFDAPRVSLQRYLVYLTFGGEGVLGNTLEIMATTVLVYVLFGISFDVSGGNLYVDQLVRRIAGKSAGAPIKATVLSSGLTGMVSGSATVNVLTSGAMTIPAMRSYGVPGPLAAGIEAVSSTVGQVTPPVMGAAAFMMASVTGVSYGQIALSAAVPALIVYWVMYLQAHVLGERVLARNAAAGAMQQAPAWSALLGRDAVLHVLPLLAVLGTVTISDRLTVQAGLLGLAGSLLVALRLKGRAGTLAALRAHAPLAVQALAHLVITGAGLGIVLAVLGITGLDVRMTSAVAQIGGGNLFAGLSLAAVMALVLGIGLPTSSAYIIVGTMLAPGLVALGVPLVAAHMFVLYFAIVSMVTPPVALAAMAASGIAGTSMTATSFQAMRFGWVLYVLPFVFVFQPGLLWLADPASNGLAVASAVLAMGAVHVLVVTRVRRPVGPVQLAGGVALCCAVTAFVGTGRGWGWGWGGGIGIGGGGLALVMVGTAAAVAAGMMLRRRVAAK